MDSYSNTDFTTFLDFCKSLDSNVVHSPEQALELFRSHRDEKKGEFANRPNNLSRDLMRLCEQIVATGTPLLSEAELDQELAAR